MLAKLSDPAAKAWDAFFSVYGPVVYRMARHARLDEHAAEEIVAIVMRNLVGTLARGLDFKPEQGRFRQYLRTIANRSIRRMHRHEMARKRGQIQFPLETIPEDEEPSDADWAVAEREERWQVCLARLRESSVVSPRDFGAFEAWVLKGETVATVAKRFGVTTNRLYGIKHTVIQRIRQIRMDLDMDLGEA